MLEDMLVLEVSDAWTGPLAGLMLADFGAEVIKVEPPEWKRTLESRLARRDDPVFIAGNRGKRNVVIDLTHPSGQEIFKELVKKADVVLSNSPPPVAAKLGLLYDNLGKVNPRIICCNISGYGMKGVDVNRPAFELAIQASAGIMSVTGEEGHPPVRAGVPMLDEKGGIFAVIAILTSYIARQKDGKGRQIDISMFDNALLSFGYNVVDYFMTGKIPGPMGSSSTAKKRADYQAYQTKDGYMVIAAGRGEDKWRDLTRTLGRAELATDPRYDSYEKRTKDKARFELEGIFKPILRTKTNEEWLKLLLAVDIPCAPVNRLDQVIQEAEASGRGMLVEFPLPTSGKVKGVGNPIKVGTKENLKPPPRFGQYTREVLKELLGYSDEKITELAKDKVIFVES